MLRDIGPEDTPGLLFDHILPNSFPVTSVHHLRETQQAAHLSIGLHLDQVAELQGPGLTAPPEHLLLLLELQVGHIRPDDPQQ